VKNEWGKDVVGSDIFYIEVPSHYVPKGTKENKILRQDILSPGWDLTPEPAKIQRRRGTLRMET
jgi:hypothetical protein